jgi:hypothetical protein
MLRAVCSGFLAVVLAGPLLAQGASDSARLRNDCRLAVQIFTRGQPAPQEEWAWTVIQQCGAEGGVALASALRNARSSTDVDYLDRLAGRARWLRDGAVFSAAIDVTADRGASVPARLRAIIVLLYTTRLAEDHIRGIPLSYQDLLSPFDERSGLPHPTCGMGRTSAGEVRPYEGAPLPADYKDQIRTVGKDIFGDTTEPTDVRSAAFCLL